MESRKRPRVDDGDVLHSKKRVVSDSHDSPIPVNGVSEAEEPKDGDSLEMFRKDAIYRRMRHYSRENDRNLARIADLERRRNTCEAGMAALEACWSQLIATIRSLIKPDSLADVDVETRDIYDLTSRMADDADPLHIEQLRTRMHDTERLVTSFVQLGGRQESFLSQSEAHKRCQQAQTECSSLRSEISLLHAKLRNSQTEKEQYYDQLIVAEKRLDRLQSTAATKLNPDPHQASTPTIAVETEGEDLKEAKQESLPSVVMPPSPGSPIINGDSSVDKQLADSPSDTSQTVARLLQENSNLEQEVADLQLQLQAQVASEKLVKSHLLYVNLQQYASAVEQSVKDRDARIASLAAEITSLRKTRVDFEQAITTSADKAVQEHRAMIVKRDNELARIREQRDQSIMEVGEWKQKESNKQQTARENRTLADSRLERIKALSLEVTRLRTRIAAQGGDNDLMNFFFNYESDDVSYIEDLKKRLSDAERRVAAIDEAPQRTAAETRARLADATKRLQEYDSIFGEALDKLPPGVQALTKQLRAKEEEVQRLHLQEQQREQAETPLYSELERLSAAWEILDKQAKSKSFDLSILEERLARLGAEKAKSDNKFYASMRDKEALELERKTVSRHNEKQSQTLERLIAQEKNSANLAREMEVELATLREVKMSLHTKLVDVDRQRKWEKDRADANRKYADEAKAPVQEVLAELSRRRAEVAKLEDSLSKKLKEAERLANKAKASAATNNMTGSAREAQLQGEVDKCMSLLKCSTCKMNMRNTVITKCMHSFCKNCVNERISSRQRKCPACNLPFSQGEVQQLYFQ